MAVEVGPFAEAEGAEEVVAAGAVELAVAEFVFELVVEIPELEERQEVGAGVGEGGVFFVGGLLLFDGADAGVLGFEGSGDDEDFAEAVFAVGFEEHAGDADIDGEFGEAAAKLGELVAVVDGVEFVEGSVAVTDGGGFGRLDEGELVDAPELEGVHAEDDGGEVGAEDFGGGEGVALVEVVFGVEADAGAGAEPAAAAFALVGGGLADGFDG